MRALFGPRLLWRALLGHWRRHPLLLALTVLGTALGVSVVLGIDLANAAALRSMELSTTRAAGRATHRIEGPAVGLPAGLLAELRIDAGAREAVPVIERDLAVVGRPGAALRLLGIDPLSEGRLRAHLAGPGGASSELMVQPNGAAMSVETARRLELELGGSFELRTGIEARALTLVELLEPTEGLHRRLLDGVCVVDIATAAALLDQPDTIDRIDLAVPDTAAGEALLARIDARLPPGAELEPVGTRSGLLASMTRGFRLNLQALSFLALLVGAFLIFNTLRFGAVQRRETLGTARALGATGAQVRGVLLGEAALLGFAGSLFGLALGSLLARALVGGIAATITELYFALDVVRTPLEPAALAKALALGLGTSLLAAWGPANEAATLAPRLQQRRSEAERGAAAGARRALGFGAAGIVAGAALLGFSATSLVLAYAGLFAFVAGAALLAPALSAWLLPWLGAPLGRAFGSFGALIARGAAASLSRTGIAVAALAVALASSLGVAVMVQSFRGTVIGWLEQTLTSDIYISAPALTRTRQAADLDAALVERFEGLPGVAESFRYRGVELPSAEGPIFLAALALDAKAFDAYSWAAGPSPEARRQFMAGAGVLVSEPLGFRRGYGVGDVLRLDSPTGPLALPVLGVFHDYGSDAGMAVIERAAYVRAFEDEGLSSAAFRAAPGVDPDGLVETMRATLGAGEELFIRSNRALRTETMEIFDRTFAITGVLRLLTLIVALVGVLSALAAIQFDRAREFAVLRAVGMTPRQTFLLTAGQCGLLGLTAGLFALPLGFAMAWVMIHVVNKRSFGWTLLEFAWSPSVMLSTLALAVAAALLAGVGPAAALARANPSRALREE